MTIPRDRPSAELSFGFLSTHESPVYGHFGGYLIVTPLGRPLEFHCTSPVRPSRAQEILYGPTLQPYLVGEQISGALLKAAKTCPCLILVDTPAMLLARPLAKSPMALVEQQLPLDADHMALAPASSRESDTTRGIEAGGYNLILPSGLESDAHIVAELATQLSKHVDLAEPFGRIHEAIREAQRIGGRAGEAHGQAA
jgi:hypothetical protein